MAKAWEAAKDVTLPKGGPVIGPRLGRIIEAVAEQLVPVGGKLGLGVRDTDGFRDLARYLRDVDPGARLGLKALFIIFDLAPCVFIGRLARFVNLSPQEKELYLTDWAASRVYFRRMVLVLLKTLIGMGYYNDPKVLARIGFAQPCGERKPS